MSVKTKTVERVVVDAQAEVLVCDLCAFEHPEQFKPKTCWSMPKGWGRAAVTGRSGETRELCPECVAKHPAVFG